MATKSKAEVFVPPPPEETKCTHFELCNVARFGACTLSSMKSCGIIMEVKELATEQSCPACPYGHCDVPDYRALMKKGVSCGQPGKCLVVEALKGAIPPQDFISNGKVPENYKRPRLGRKDVLRIFKECSMA